MNIGWGGQHRNRKQNPPLNPLPRGEKHYTMIKFFRKIRQRLLSENKFSRYLLYAIGEIILVVIGILIALQINTWNQARKDSITERAYYNRFLEDVLLDEALVINQIEQTKLRLKSANQLIHELQSSDSNMPKIAQALRGSVSRGNFVLKPTQTTYEDVKSSGNVQLIKDLELKKSLENYYVSTTGIMNTINVNAARLGQKMFAKDEMIWTGIFQLAKMQNGFDSTKVDINKLEQFGELNARNKKVLLNNGVIFVSLSSRNIEHYNALKEIIIEMKKELEVKCKNDAL